METKESLVEEFRRGAILKAAHRVIARRGIAATSMQAIAKEARLAKGTLYLYFRDRDELVEQSARAAFTELFERIRVVLGVERPLRESLRAVIKTQLEFFDAHRELLRVYMELRGAEGAPCARRGRGAQLERYLELLTAHLAAAQRRGEMKPFDPAQVAVFVAEGMAAILKHRLGERGRKKSEDAEWIVDLLLDGLCIKGRS